MNIDQEQSMARQIPLQHDPSASRKTEGVTLKEELDSCQALQGTPFAAGGLSNVFKRSKGREDQRVYIQLKK